LACVPRSKEWTMHRLFPCVCLMLVALAAPFSTGQSPDKKPSSSISKKADPAGTALLMGQLRALFAEWDANQDEYLDKEELARGFRGPDAKPPSPSALKSKSTEPTLPTKGKNAGRESGAYPDHDFLLQVDLNADGKISRDEFISWAREYAVQQKNIAAAEKRVGKAEIKARSRTSARTLAQAELELRNERQALSKLMAQLPSFDKALQEALNPQAPGRKGKK
jgi:hypothetical protein